MIFWMLSIIIVLLIIIGMFGYFIYDLCKQILGHQKVEWRDYVSYMIKNDKSLDGYYLRRSSDANESN